MLVSAASWGGTRPLAISSTCPRVKMMYSVEGDVPNADVAGAVGADHDRLVRGVVDPPHRDELRSVRCRDLVRRGRRLRLWGLGAASAARERNSNCDRHRQQPELFSISRGRGGLRRDA
jgi:hypothetical protein